jgi:hypothetical protein
MTIAQTIHISLNVVVQWLKLLQQVGRSWMLIVLTEGVCNISEPLQENGAMVPEIRTRLPLFTPLPIVYSLFILSFVVT